MGKINYRIMRKFLLLSVLPAVVLASGCDKPQLPPETVPEIRSVVLSDDGVSMFKGDGMDLGITVDSDEGYAVRSVVWETSSPSVVAVEDGKIVATGKGEAFITVCVDEKVSDTCTVTVYDPAVGDYLYEDGSFSSQPEDGKTPVAIVYWLGDPGEDDALLAGDFPDCTHGLAVSMEQRTSYWQYWYDVYQSSISEWIAENAPRFNSIATGIEESDPLNKKTGYNNTKALEAFNADPANAEWPVELAECLLSFRSEVPAPQGTSGWYIPSAKEISMVCSGDLPGNIWGQRNQTSNMELLNVAISRIPGMPVLEGLYWSSSEYDEIDVFDLNFYFGDVYYAQKDFEDNVRFVLAF